VVLDRQTGGRELLDAARQRVEDRAREALAPYAPVPLPRLDPDWPVDLTLSDGRRLRATVKPGLARRSDLEALRETTASNNERNAAALRRQAEALERLRRKYDALAGQLAAMQSQATQSLVQLAEGVRGVERRVATVRTQNRALVTRARATRVAAVRQKAEMRTMASAARMQQVTAVVNSTQAAAYGQRGSVFATNNLLLATNQLFWTFLDPALRGLGVVKGTTPSLAVWLAPLGSLVTAQVALGNRQHDRFVSGVITLRGGAPILAHSLQNDIASAYWPTFKERTDVPVTIEGLDGLNVAGLGIFAIVRGGTLFITLRDTSGEDFDSLEGRIAWMIDLGADFG